jgi:hypothetical protein
LLPLLEVKLLKGYSLREYGFNLEFVVMLFAASRHLYPSLLWVKDSSHCRLGFVPDGNGALLGQLWLASDQGARLFTMIATTKPLLFGQPNFLLEDEQKIIARLIQAAAITGV